MTEYVVGFAFNRNIDQLVLIEKQRPDWQRGKLNGVGGKVDIVELPIDAMIREFAEETGVELIDWWYFGRLRGPDHIVHLYTIFDDQIKRCRTTTDESIAFIHPRDLPANVVPNLRWIVPAALQQFTERFVITAEYK